MYYKKSLGQNFLVDHKKLSYIAQLCKYHTIIEIGGGQGALSQYLADTPHYYIIEKDTRFISPLSQFSSNVICADALNVNFDNLANDFYIVGNLPYCVATKILLNILFNSLYVKKCIFLMQEDVVRKLAAKVGEADYGALSILVQYGFYVEKSIKVPPGCFRPVPKVRSQVVVLNKKKSTCLANLKKLSAILKQAFASRRKKLKSLVGQEYFEYFMNKYPDSVRAEQITPEDFWSLAKLI